ncbi:PucR family transcriptional regulator [Nocardia carnea]|uniref:PucR family transcriptional regulator n=1 Tax=Nocardia carnea TaxID=37328 RepID=UPI002456B457|nr:helix-turn-helix domain-containing protein [Nocardia carnea]
MTIATGRCGVAWPTVAADKKPGPVASARELAAACRSEIPALTQQLLAAVFTDNPEWTDYSAVTRADLVDGCRRFLTRVLDLLGGRAEDAEQDDVAAAIGRQRAEQGVPLEAMLRTFRLGGRIVWEALLDRAGEVPPAEFRETGTAMWAVIDRMSSALVTSYRNTEMDRVRRDERRRHSLIEDVLAGQARDSLFAARAARELDLPVHGDYLVVVARGDAHPMHTGSETALLSLGVRSAWHERADSTVGIVALEGRPIEPVLRQLRPKVRGRAAASPAVAGLAAIGTAHGLALLALDTIAQDAAGVVVSLDDRYPEALLLRAPDLTELLIARTLGPVLGLPEKEREILLGTLSAWLAAGCSAANAAPRLHCHRNTVINRLQRISTLLGRPLEGPRAQLEFSLALAALDLGAAAGIQSHTR